MSENRGCLWGILIIVIPFALWYYFVDIPATKLEEEQKIENKKIEDKKTKIRNKAANDAKEKGIKDTAIGKFDATIDSCIYYDFYNMTFGDSLSHLYIDEYVEKYKVEYDILHNIYKSNKEKENKKPKSASEQSAYDEGWKKGYNQGYEEGYATGYFWGQKK